MLPFNRFKAYLRNLYGKLFSKCTYSGFLADKNFVTSTQDKNNFFRLKVETNILSQHTKIIQKNPLSQEKGGKRTWKTKELNVL